MDNKFKTAVRDMLAEREARVRHLTEMLNDLNDAEPDHLIGRNYHFRDVKVGDPTVGYGAVVNRETYRINYRATLATLLRDRDRRAALTAETV